MQDTALNGAQVQSLQGIVQSVASKELPAEAAIEVLVVSFPSIGRVRAEKMVRAAERFDPPTPTPTPVPPTPPQPAQ